MDPDTFFFFPYLLNYPSILCIHPDARGCCYSQSSSFPMSRQRNEKQVANLFSAHQRCCCFCTHAQAQHQLLHVSLGERWRGSVRTHEPSYEVLGDEKTAFQLVFESINRAFRAAYHFGHPVNGLLQWVSNNSNSLSSQMKTKGRQLNQKLWVHGTRIFD